ncbi:MAG: PRD domain-containing protein, partial [Bacilli bacterium]
LASELVATAYQLSAPARVIAVDLPLRQSRSVSDEAVLRAIEAVDHGGGALVLTDARELLQLQKRHPGRLQDRKLQFVLRPDLTKAVTTMRLLATTAGTVDQLAAMLGTERSPGFASEAETRVVWTCCLTGRGTAQSLKRLIESCTPDDMRAGMEIIPVELLPNHSELPDHERVVAAVGSIDPRIEGVPFFSVEELLTERGMERLLNVVSQGRLSGWESADAGRAPTVGPTEGSVHDYIRTMLERDLVFANPKLVVDCAKAMIDRLRQKIALPDESTWEARFWLHMGYVIERCVKGEPVDHPYAQRIRTTFAQEWDVLAFAWTPVAETFRLEADEGELAYLFEMIFTGRSFEEFPP